MKKCFTINCMRTKEDFVGYNEMITNNVYQGIEIFYPYNVSLEQRDFYTNNIREIRKKYPNLEIVMHLPHGPKNSLTNEYLPQSYQLMIDAIEYSKEFGVKKLTLHLGTVDNDKPREEYVNNIIGILKDLCDYSKKYNMNVMIENMPGMGELGVSPDELLKIIEGVGKDNIKFILDTGHAFVSGYPLSEFVFKLKDYLYHMHFNDCDGTRDEHKRMHLGKIDFNELFKSLNEINYKELHCMEVIFKDYRELIDFANDLDLYKDCYK